MSEGYDGDDEIIEVPFDSRAWDEAIDERKDLGRLEGDRRLVFTAGRLVVDRGAATDGAVDRELGRAGAKRCDDAAEAIAQRLGLVIYDVGADKLIDAIGAINKIAPGSASLEHVWMPGANRIHGDDEPLPASDPGGIPGSDPSAGSDVQIFVLDTGIAEVPFPVDARPQDAEVADEDDDDRRDHAAGHGTHVAGVIARTAAGAAITARRLLTTPIGMAGEFETAAAITAAGAEGAQLINCSFGGVTLDDVPPLITQRAIAELAPGTVVVAAAGNTGKPRPSWPAALEGVIAVGAVAPAPNGGWGQAGFSSHGGWVDCCAPGVAIVSTFLRWPGGPGAPAFDGFAAWTGTSFAAPQVTAALAALAKRDGISLADAAQRLVYDAGRPRIGAVGTFVDVQNLP